MLEVMWTDDRLSVVGDLDAASCHRLAQALADPPTVFVVLDMSGVAFIDSSALREIIEARFRLRRDGGSLRIMSPSRVVQRLLEVTDLSDQFGVSDAQQSQVFVDDVALPACPASGPAIPTSVERPIVPIAKSDMERSPSIVSMPKTNARDAKGSRLS